MRVMNNIVAVVAAVAYKPCDCTLRPGENGCSPELHPVPLKQPAADGAPYETEYISTNIFSHDFPGLNMKN